MKPYALSLFLVAFAEMGDRTQLLAVMLATTYRQQPWSILAGILLASAANHALAALAGYYLSSFLTAPWFKYLVALSFVAMAAWALVPDKDSGSGERHLNVGVFLVTVVSFFIVEIGDKTQIATAALAARFHNVVLVVAGTTSGMLIANIPAVLLGPRITQWISIKTFRIGAAALYGTLGFWSLAEAAGVIR